jgi:hypothetical protein
MDASGSGVRRSYVGAPYAAQGDREEAQRLLYRAFAHSTLLSRKFIIISVAPIQVVQAAFAECPEPIVRISRKNCAGMASESSISQFDEFEKCTKRRWYKPAAGIVEERA